MAYRSQVDLLKDGSQIVEELRDETGETVQLSVLENDMMLVLLKEEGVAPDPHHQPGRLARAGELGGGRAGCSSPTWTTRRCRALLTATIRQSPTGRAITDVPKLIAADPEVPQAGLCHRAQRDQRACRLRRRAGHRRAPAAASPPSASSRPSSAWASTTATSLIDAVRDAAGEAVAAGSARDQRRPSAPRVQASASRSSSVAFGQRRRADAARSARRPWPGSRDSRR